MTQKIISNIVFCTALVLCALLWYSTQAQFMSNGNIAWLTMGAERLLDGQSLSDHIYETNPPLSILIYIPAVLIGKLFAIPAVVANTYLTFFLCCLSVFAVHCLLKKFNFLSDNNRKSVLIGYFVGITTYAALFFGDREHLMILALVPFVLCQICLIQKTTVQKSLLLPCMIAGATLVLVKPHYGIIPVAIMLERVIRERKIASFFRADFWALSISTLLYAAILLIFFNDYLIIIFPDVFNLYVASYDTRALLALLQTSAVLFFAFILIEIFDNDLEKEKKTFLLRLYLCAALCLIPFIVQFKGFYNHIIPAYVFFITAMPLTVSFRMDSFKGHFQILSLAVPIVAVAMLTNAINPPILNFAKRSDLPSLPVSEFLDKNCENPCTFFAFHGDIEIFNPTAAHHGYTHGTRFPAHWFIPGVLHKIHNGDAQEQEKGRKLLVKYAQMVLEDLKFYRPDIIFLQNNLNEDQGAIVDFIETYKVEPEIIRILENDYEQKEFFSFDRAQYFKGTKLEEEKILRYDVYKKKSN